MLGAPLLAIVPKTTTTTVTQNENGQYQVTIPKAMGDALELAGAPVKWDIVSGSKLAFEKTNE